jgi:hypothetical protein
MKPLSPNKSFNFDEQQMDSTFDKSALDSLLGVPKQRVGGQINVSSLEGLMANDNKGNFLFN